MKIVIDIDDKLYNRIKYLEPNADTMLDELMKSVQNGTPLPKGHGRLIDADRLETHFIGTEQGTDLEVYLEPTIMSAPTIIEADRG